MGCANYIAYTYKLLVVESDSQEVVNFVNSRLGSRSKIFWVISKTHDLMKGFDNASIQCDHRSCNIIIHSLAKLTLKTCETVVYMGPYRSQLLFLFSPTK